MPQVHDKATETASPGYYAVTFKDAQIRTEITLCPHTAFYRFTYGGDRLRRLLVDCQSVLGGRARWQFCRAAVTLGADRRGLSGTIERHCWVARTYSFAMTFDRPYAKMAELPRTQGEKAPRYVFDFDLKPGEALEVRVALSAEGNEAVARKNLEVETKGMTFDAARAQMRADWNALFGRAAASTCSARRSCRA